MIAAPRSLVVLALVGVLAPSVAPAQRPDPTAGLDSGGPPTVRLDSIEREPGFALTNSANGLNETFTAKPGDHLAEFVIGSRVAQIRREASEFEILRDGEHYGHIGAGETYPVVGHAQVEAMRADVVCINCSVRESDRLVHLLVDPSRDHLLPWIGIRESHDADELTLHQHAPEDGLGLAPEPDEIAMFTASRGEEVVVEDAQPTRRIIEYRTDTSRGYPVVDIIERDGHSLVEEESVVLDERGAGVQCGKKCTLKLDGIDASGTASFVIDKEPYRTPESDMH